jgi:hypothetical protein
MIVFSRLLAALFLVWSAVVQAQVPGNAVITLKMMPDGAYASIELDRAVDHFLFAPTSVVRAGDFEIITPGLTLQNDEIRAAEPFRRFEIRIKPTNTERDAAYPAHYRVGDGGVVYVPSLKGDEATWRTHLRFETEPGQVRLPTGGDAMEGFVFIGPAELRTEYTDLIVIADPNAPAWLVELARTAQTTVVSLYSRMIGVPLPEKPVLVVRYWGTDERNTYTGDVPPGLVTAVRFHGPAWSEPDEAASKVIRSFLFHESFHLWNGALTSHAEGTPTWLHEGGAEYAALLGGLETGALTDTDARRMLSEALQRCRSGLQSQGDRALSALAFLSNQVRYPCGMVLQWAADLHLRKVSSGRRNMMEAWAEMISAARSRASGEYGLTDFYASARIVQPDAFAPGVLLIDQSGPARWEALPDALNALGAEVDFATPTPDARRRTLLLHLLQQNCGSANRYGFSREAGVIKLDSPDYCGPLAGSPRLADVEGGSLLDVTEETYAAVQKKCAANAAVTVTTADGRELSASCATPLGPSPRDFDVKLWMPAAEVP